MKKKTSAGRGRRSARIVAVATVALSVPAGLAVAAGTQVYLSNDLMAPNTATVSSYHGTLSLDYVHDVSSASQGTMGCGSPEWSTNYRYTVLECTANFNGTRNARGYAENANGVWRRVNAHVDWN